ncbi:MAG TPA: sugar ABC transporter permease, partial [Chloroflexota bacterium]|nr:sugar ABC transporter permease [Chloroflexota bacterium]
MGEKRRETGNPTGVGISQFAPASLVRPSTTSRLYRLRNSEAVLAMICLGPAVLVLAVVLAYPVLYELGLAFFNKNVLHPDQGVTFAGLNNFVWLFIGNDRFRIAVLHSILLTFGDVSLELILGMIAALMLVNPFKGVSVVRSLAILPWAIPPVVVAFVFRAMLSPEFGLVNQIIRAVLSLVQQQPVQFSYDWLSQPTTAFIAT